MSNILKAFINIVNNYQTAVASVTTGNNRVNNMGEGLEEYIKDAFADTMNEANEQNRLQKFSQIYPYSGNKNNPPDLILKNSDAIEIKKLESHTTAIALNSSYPKAKLFSDSTMITTACRSCEEWSQKDMLYTIGNVPKNTNQLKSLWLVYGDCFCADKEIYERIKDTISNGITSIPNVEFKQFDIGDLALSSITVSELYHGVYKSSYVEKNLLALEHFLRPFNILDYDLRASVEYGKIRASLEKSGKAIGGLDMMIAAHAKSLGAILVTNNTGEFKRVENLIIENWVQE